MALSFLGVATAQNEADVAQLLNGVRGIAPGNTNGALIVFGEQAFPVANAQSQSGATEPLIAAGRVGQGRVVVFGNTTILEHDLQVADTARFTTNILNWASGGKAAPRVGIYRINGLTTRFKALGIDAHDIALADTASVDVVLVLGRMVVNADVAPLLEYVRGGGGLVTGATGFISATRIPGQEFSTAFPANRLIAAAGLLWGRGVLSSGAAPTFRIEPPPELSHAAKALAALEGNQSHERSLSGKEILQVTTTLRSAAADLPKDDTLLLSALKRLAVAPAARSLPAEGQPNLREAAAPSPHVTANYTIPPAAAFDRLVEATRLWAYVKYIHTRVTEPGVDWDQAFIDAVPMILESKSDEEFARAVNAMLAPLHDPFTCAVNPAGQKTDHRVVMAIRRDPKDVMVVGFSAGDEKQAEASRRAVMGRVAGAKAVVFDYRGIRVHDRGPGGAFPIATVKRTHHGYLGQMPDYGDAEYKSSWQTEKGEEGAAGSAWGGHCPVFLVNSATIIPDMAVSMQALHGCAIVSEDAISDAQAQMGSSVTAGNLRVWVRTREFERPDGTSGLTANVVLNQTGDAALQAALELARSGKWPPPMERSRFRRPPAVFTEKNYSLPYPATELRLLAAARIWGVYNYFHPYKYLYGEDWDAVLAQYLPGMAAAKNAREYQFAVAGMVTHAHDTHCFVYSTEINRTLGGFRPPIEVRWIENLPVVTRVAGDETAGMVHPGDVVTKIDGEPVKKRIDELSALIASSTPQSLLATVMRFLLNRRAGSDARVTFRGADGIDHDVSLSKLDGNPQDLATRRSGEVYRLLTPKIGYVDLDRLTQSQVDAMLDRFQNTDSIVMDMRGYPHYTAQLIAPRLATSPDLLYALVRINVVSADAKGTVQSDLIERHIPVTDKPRYKGKTVLLIDDGAGSASEHNGLWYKTANGTVFIGSPTMGMDGSVTGFMAPGSISVSFSGMDVRWPDGRQLQRVGLIPDIEAHATIEGIRAGRDEVLERALAYLEKGR